MTASAYEADCGLNISVSPLPCRASSNHLGRNDNAAQGRTRARGDAGPHPVPTAVCGLIPSLWYNDQPVTGSQSHRHTLRLSV